MVKVNLNEVNQSRLILKGNPNLRRLGQGSLRLYLALENEDHFYPHPQKPHPSAWSRKKFIRPHPRWTSLARTVNYDSHETLTLIRQQWRILLERISLTEKSYLQKANMIMLINTQSIYKLLLRPNLTDKHAPDINSIFTICNRCTKMSIGWRSKWCWIRGYC